MIVMSQFGDHSVIANPGIAMGNYSGLLTILMTIDRIDSKPLSVSSSGSEMLTSALYPDNSKTDIVEGICNVTINVTTDYPDEWFDFFTKEFTTFGLHSAPLNSTGVYYNLTVVGRNVSAYVQSGQNNMVLELFDSDFITTIGNKVIPPVSPLPVPHASPTPTPTPTPTPSPVPNALYMRPTQQLKTAPNPTDGSTTLQPFLLLFPDTETWTQSPAMNGTYTLQGPVSVYLYENNAGLLGLIQYQTVTLYKVSSTGHQTQIGSTSSWGTLLSLSGTGVSIVPATFNLSGGSVTLNAGDKLMLEVSYGGLLNLNAITIRQSPTFTSRIELVNTLPT